MPLTSRLDWMGEPAPLPMPKKKERLRGAKTPLEKK